jgi:biopolymer transport protein ExbD
MGKIKLAVKTPRIDMTPMVDLFFLLLIFFILTATFRPQESVQVDTPASTSQTPIPGDKQFITITISKDDKVYFNVDNGSDSSQHIRGKVLQAIGSQYQIRFSPQEIKKFEGMASFGLPVVKLKDWLNAKDQKARDAIEDGVPVDSTDNQLMMWIRFARTYNNDLQVAIKGDGASNYPVVKKVIDVLQNNNVNKFNLTTNLEKVDVTLDNL